MGHAIEVPVEGSRQWRRKCDDKKKTSNEIITVSLTNYDQLRVAPID